MARRKGEHLNGVDDTARKCDTGLSMKRLNYSNFELIEDVISELKFNYSESEAEKLNKIADVWVEVVGNKFSQFTKVLEVSADNNLTIVCSDSFVANELYLKKENILKLLREKCVEQGIEINIVDLNINYRRWK